MRPKTGVEVLPMVDTGTADLWQSDCHQGVTATADKLDNSSPWGTPPLQTRDMQDNCSLWGTQPLLTRTTGQDLPLGDTTSADMRQAGQVLPMGDTTTEDPVSWTSASCGRQSHCRPRKSWTTATLGDTVIAEPGQ